MPDFLLNIRRTNINLKCDKLLSSVVEVVYDTPGNVCKSNAHLDRFNLNKTLAMI